MSEESLPKNSPRIGILTGPTASGKSGIALELAIQNPKIEIINADSLLVYRGMDIGTAKPTREELHQVPHHLIDVRNPAENFTAGEFLRAANVAIEEIHQRGKRVLIVGGTGFYLKSLLFGLWNAPAADPKFRTELEEKSNEVLYEELHQKDPLLALKIGPADRYRLIRALEVFHLTGKSPQELQSQIAILPDPRFKLWIINRPNSDIYDRIQKRTLQMLNQGLIEEVKKLQALFPESRALSAVGYAQVWGYLSNKSVPGRKIKPGLEGLSEEIQLATRQLVKSQRTWFRGQKLRVPDSKWFELDADQGLLEEEFKWVYEQRGTG